MKNSFRDSVTNVLKAYGYTEANGLGDVKQVEADNFALEPGKWQWNGTAWVAFVPPPIPPNPLKALIDLVLADSTVPTSLKNLLTAWKTQITP